MDFVHEEHCFGQVAHAQGVRALPLVVFVLVAAVAGDGVKRALLALLIACLVLPDSNF